MVVPLEMLRGKLLVATADERESHTLIQALDAHHFCAEVVDSSLSHGEPRDSQRVDLALIGSDRPEALRYCAALRRDAATLPVVFLLAGSAEGRDSFEQAAFEAGADDVLYGPFSAGVARRVENLIRHRQHYVELEQRSRDHEKHIAHAKESARQFNILKDSIINNVSHEMRTPLLQVKSAVGMMDAENSGQANNLTRMIEFAKQSTARLESVVLNISQLANTMNLKSEPFKPADAVSIAMRQLTRLWSTAKQVYRVHQHTHPQVPLAQGDKNGVGQVLQQLIHNGLKFSPEGSPVEVTIEAQAEQVRFAVVDYGIGIDRAQFERIFQMFYQVDWQSTRKYEGAGVGLAIVRYILDQMGVQIHLESEPGKGSTFSFSLPIARLS